MKSSLGTVSDAEVLAARAVQDFKAMQYDLGRCDLWLAECERLWWFKRIDLDESELKWVHRYRATLPIAPPSSL